MQARSVAEKLKQYDIQHVYISPFYRCALLAAAMAPLLSVAGLPLLALANWCLTLHITTIATPCRCIQTARLTSEGLKIPPERWTVSVAVCEVRTWASPDVQGGITSLSLRC